MLLGPLLVSLLLIATGAVLDVAGIPDPVVKFISEPVVALLIGLIGTSIVGRYAFGAKNGSSEPSPPDSRRADRSSSSPASAVRWPRRSRPTGLGDILGEYFTASTPRRC